MLTTIFAVDHCSEDHGYSRPWVVKHERPLSEIAALYRQHLDDSAKLGMRPVSETFANFARWGRELGYIQPDMTGDFQLVILNPNSHDLKIGGVTFPDHCP
jgi:hypothetical protein